MSDTFHLLAPPGFRGLHPDLPIRVYQRHLPHWRQPGATYFVTFRLAGSLPQSKLLALKRWRLMWERQHPGAKSEADWKSLAREITARTERWLDEGYGHCELRLPEVAQLMEDSIHRFQARRYFVSCFVLMPNHVHLTIQPQGGYELEEILRNMKGYVARKANSWLGREGAFWDQESYDRIVRDEEHLFRVLQYIGRNPARAGLPKVEGMRWVDPSWEAAGWGFRDARD
jgi:REP element-mobilizing transposase RayT